MGRLLITLFLVERGVLPSPLLYLSAFFEATRADYYELLTGVSERGAWHDWLLYFVHGVAHQANDALGRAARMNQLLDAWRRQLGARHTPNVAKLLDRLASNPFITAAGAVQHLDVAFTTAQRAIAVLKEHGIVQQTSEARRDRVFCAKALLDILEEPTEIETPG